MAFLDRIGSQISAHPRVSETAPPHKWRLTGDGLLSLKFVGYELLHETSLKRRYYVEGGVSSDSPCLFQTQDGADSACKLSRQLAKCV